MNRHKNRDLIDTKTDTSTETPVEPSVENPVEESVEKSVEKSIKKSIKESVEESQNVYRQMIESMGGVASFGKGVSMRPLIKQGKSYVSVVAVNEPQVGDILLFEQMRRGEKKNILHRLIEILPDGTYVCRGDNCLGCEHIRREEIIGRADRIFWTKHACSLMPRFLGAERDRQNGGWVLPVTAPGYLRYVRFWNAIWPFRRISYRLRGKFSPRRLYWRLRARLARIPWLYRIYRTIRR